MNHGIENCKKKQAMEETAIDMRIERLIQDSTKQ